MWYTSFNNFLIKRFKCVFIGYTTFNGIQLEVVEDFAEVQYVTGKSIGGDKLN